MKLTLAFLSIAYSSLVLIKKGGLRNKIEGTILVKTIPEGLQETMNSTGSNGIIPIAQDRGFKMIRLCFVSTYVDDYNREGS